MTCPHDDVLRAVAERTFEDMAFMFSMGEDEAGAGDPPRVTAAVRFDGPVAGTLTVSLSEDGMCELATNMLGIEDGQAPTRTSQEDALKELANVICGNVLPEVAGNEAVFDVRAPEILAPTGRIDESFLVGRAHLDLDTGPADLSLYLDRP